MDRIASAICDMLGFATSELPASMTINTPTTTTVMPLCDEILWIGIWNACFAIALVYMLFFTAAKHKLVTVGQQATTAASPLWQYLDRETDLYFENQHLKIVNDTQEKLETLLTEAVPTMTDSHAEKLVKEVVADQDVKLERLDNTVVFASEKREADLRKLLETDFLTKEGAEARYESKGNAENNLSICLATKKHAEDTFASKAELKTLRDDHDDKIRKSDATQTDFESRLQNMNSSSAEKQVAISDAISKRITELEVARKDDHRAAGEQKAALDKQLAEMQSAFENQLVEQKSAFQELMKQMESNHLAEITKLEEKFGKCSNDLSDLTSKQAQDHATIANIRTATDAVGGQGRTIADHKESIQKLQGQVNSLRHESETIHSGLKSQAEGNANSLEALQTKVQQQIGSQVKVTETLQKKTTALEATAKEHESALADVREQAKQLTTDAEVLRAASTQFSTKLASYGESIQVLQGRVSAQETAVTEAQEGVAKEDVSAEVARLRSDFEEFKAISDNSEDSEIVLLRGDFDATNGKVQNLKLELESLGRMFEKQGDEISSLNLFKNKANARLSDGHNDIERLRSVLLGHGLMGQMPPYQQDAPQQSSGYEVQPHQQPAQQSPEQEVNVSKELNDRIAKQLDEQSKESMRRIKQSVNQQFSGKKEELEQWRKVLDKEIRDDAQNVLQGITAKQEELDHWREAFAAEMRAQFETYLQSGVRQETPPKAEQALQEKPPTEEQVSQEKPLSADQFPPLQSPATPDASKPPEKTSSDRKSHVKSLEIVNTGTPSPAASEEPKIAGTPNTPTQGTPNGSAASRYATGFNPTVPGFNPTASREPTIVQTPNTPTQGTPTGLTASRFAPGNSNGGGNSGSNRNKGG